MDIEHFKTTDEAQKKGYSIHLSENEYKIVKPMNRRQRREWAKKGAKNG